MKWLQREAVTADYGSITGIRARECHRHENKGDKWEEIWLSPVGSFMAVTIGCVGSGTLTEGKQAVWPSVRIDPSDTIPVF